ncbi:MAG: RluA family pseudouridine synthase [Actinomycetota bacterium]|nr:RluA family pseudouridine synthase [Actinomycetota bacterium]
MTPELAGLRADKVVARLAGVSRASARRLIEEGQVEVEGVAVDPRQRLKLEALVEIEISPGVPVLEAEQVPFSVLFEDEEVAVVDKPAGVVAHPGAGRHSGTLAAGLLHRWPEVEGVGEEHRWGLVHRLDRDTSGVLLVARTSQAHRSLQRDLAARRVERHYLALVHGELAAPTGTIDAPIGRDPDRPTRRAVVRGGRRARTHYQARVAWRALSLLLIKLESGRTHQVRVHLSSIGHPLVGDRTYGSPGPPGADPGRTWLHAARLSFRHPSRGEWVEVRAPLPADLRASLEALGEPAWGSVPSEI